MGQYFKPIILSADRKTPKYYAHAHDLGQGLKFIEHSWRENPLCNVVYNYLKANNGANLVWAGDYATEEPGTERTLYEMTEECDKMPYVTDSIDSSMRYLINDDKKQFVDLWLIPYMAGHAIDPLPVLTCEGGGYAGWGTNQQLEGTWARDFIRIARFPDTMHEELTEQGYTEIRPNFITFMDIVTGLETAVSGIESAKADGTLDEDSWTTEKIVSCTQQLSDLLLRKKKTAKH
jgi:hypothetical protein